MDEEKKPPSPEKVRVLLSDHLAKVEQILFLTDKGFALDKIASATQMNPLEVQRIVEERATYKRSLVDNYKKKLPTLKEAIAIGIDGIRDRLEEMLKPTSRLETLKKISDVRNLVAIIKELNELVRLEQEQSTENIRAETRSYSTTRHVIQELQKMDPVFAYPDLPKADDAKPDEPT